jgi:pyruvate, orthophosphate dikinase
MSKTQRMVYFFGNGKADGRGDQKELLGGKGAGLAEMTRIGLPVPCGFTITTTVCAEYNRRGRSWPNGLEKQIREGMARMERTAKKKLGAAKDPLLVSVRSGAAHSMPGMMETILNLGLNDESVLGLAEASGNRRFAFDAYRRFIMMYGATARGIKREHFDDAFDELKRSVVARRLVRGPDETINDTEVNAEELESLCDTFKDIYREHVGDAFPQDPFVQLKGAINAVFDSWMADKAVTYRRVERISGLAGTAVNVCQMVFGNMGDDSGTGVCFTRDPSTGEETYYGDLLINAQGEDVVAGVRTPLPLEELKGLMPEAYAQLEAVRVMLEVHYKEMQDIEFTIERGKLFMLQCRTGKRSPQAAFKIAVDQATKGLMSASEAQRLVKKKYLPAKYVKPAAKPVITREQAIQRIQASDVERLFYPVIDPQVPPGELSSRKIGSGIGAVPGAACGEVVFTAQDAEHRAGNGTKIILVRKETSPEDVGGMHAAVGILTATGGKTSHAAVVARGWGKSCIVGCEGLRIDYAGKQLLLNGRAIHEGEYITLDGSTGTVYEGRLNLVRPEAPPEFDTLLGWCDEYRRLGVRANADTPADAARAVELGAEGIGLCRTEHMFFESSEPRRLSAMREMILANNEHDRRRALEKLLPFQRHDFEGIFAAMDGRPVTVRLLDPPLHEFLPQPDNREGLQAVVDELDANIREELAKLTVWDDDRRRELEAKRVTPHEVARRIEGLHESNPMLGHRGCRLCITYPEILDMQVRAIIEAAINVRERGIDAIPEIMIPLSIDDRELGLLIARTRSVSDRLIAERDSDLEYLVGTMIETPRAALLADRLAVSSDFFSFGTNDLTQMTLGLSRDDAGRFLPDYLREPRNSSGTGQELPHDGLVVKLENKYLPIFTDDPFQTIDTDGVGMLVYLAVDSGREVHSSLKLGVCGEHGGDPQSIRFCDAVGLDYVSCSPLRVPVARLAAAQAVLAPEGPSGLRKGASASRSSRPKGKKAAPASPKKSKRSKAKAGKKKTSRKKAAKKSRKAVSKTTKKRPAKARRTSKAKSPKRTSKAKKGGGAASKSSASKGSTKRASAKRVTVRPSIPARRRASLEPVGV